MRLNVEDITGVVGILPTPAKPGSDHWNATETVAVPELERLTRAVVAAGTEILMTTGTFGEAATLTWDELCVLVDCVVQNSGGRPVFAGVTTLNTRDTISRAKGLMDIGASGLFVGRPMWLALDQEQIVRFYQDLAAALPGVPLIVYDNPLAFKGKISSESYEQIALIPEVVAAKHVGGPALEHDVVAVKDSLRILPLETDWLPIAKQFPDLVRACWSGNVACGPTPIAALSRAILAREWDVAQGLHDELNWAVETMFPNGDLAAFMNYSIPLGHARFRTAGIIDPGPTRPPYTTAPADFIAGCEEVGRRFAQLERRYAATAPATATATR